ncbi:MAG TPA: AraC family transcriptional regulator [Solirubrobacteraceae bacterium]|nr:AraC family transcriptional regulator [Solirubrobacteraceae bacterium]
MKLSLSATQGEREGAPRGIVSVALLVAYAQEAGVAAERCLRGSGITAAALADPTAEVSLAQELVVVENVLARLGPRPGLGIEVGLRYGLEHYGIFGFAALSSSTLGEAIAVAERYLELAYALVDLRVESGPDGVGVVLEPQRLAEGLRRFAVERDAAAVARFQRELLGDAVAFSEVSFTFAAPDAGDTEALGIYRRAFGIEPRFSVEVNRLASGAELLARPLPRASAFAAAQCRAQCEALIDRRHRRIGVAGHVRSELLADPRVMPGQTEVADRLAMSVRTLRRHLTAEGTSFRGLVNETRLGLAQELLETGQLGVDAVAERLGYADAPSFVHAFTRWTGVPPGRWRRGTRPA